MIEERKKCPDALGFRQEPVGTKNGREAHGSKTVVTANKPASEIFRKGTDAQQCSKIQTDACFFVEGDLSAPAKFSPLPPLSMPPPPSSVGEKTIGPIELKVSKGEEKFRSGGASNLSGPLHSAPASFDPEKLDDDDVISRILDEICSKIQTDARLFAESGPSVIIGPSVVPKPPESFPLSFISMPPPPSSVGEKTIGPIELKVSKGEEKSRSGGASNLSGPLRSAPASFDLETLDDDVISRILDEIVAEDVKWGARWVESFMLLRDFIKEHGHSRVLIHQSEGVNNPLGVWTSKQRKYIYKALHGSVRTMTPNKIVVLEAVGFWWGSKVDAEDVRNYLMNNKKRGEEKPRRQTNENHCVPSHSTPANHLDDEAINRILIEINTDDVRWGAKWVEKFNQLRDFIQEHGHSRVPIHQSKGLNNPLGVWISKQRKYFLKTLVGSYNALTPKKIMVLEAVGFWWGKEVDVEKVGDRLKYKLSAEGLKMVCRISNCSEAVAKESAGSSFKRPHPARPSVSPYSPVCPSRPPIPFITSNRPVRPPLVALQPPPLPSTVDQMTGNQPKKMRRGQVWEGDAPPPVPQAAAPKRRKGRPKKKPPRAVRKPRTGPRPVPSAETLICGKCGWKAVSVQGLRYHTAKRVCERRSNKHRSPPPEATKPCETGLLNSGDLFLTGLGVVEVLSDDGGPEGARIVRCRGVDLPHTARPAPDPKYDDGTGSGEDEQIRVTLRLREGPMHRISLHLRRDMLFASWRYYPDLHNIFSCRGCGGKFPSRRSLAVHRRSNVKCGTGAVRRRCFPDDDAPPKRRMRSGDHRRNKRAFGESEEEDDPYEELKELRARKKRERSKERANLEAASGKVVTRNKNRKKRRTKGCFERFEKTQAGMIKAFITTGKLPTGHTIPRGWVQKSYITFNPARSSIYPAAYCSLEFLRGDSKINKRYDMATRPIAAKKAPLIPKERHGNNRPDAPIDVAMFVRQADTGRFTNKFIRGHYDHSNRCRTCMKTGETTGPNRLRGCVYCSNSNHIRCIEKIFPVIAPRDDEDFLCITCMRGVRCRLKRAERRASERNKVRELEKASLSQPYPILVPGMAFDTFLGVVQVVRDARIPKDFGQTKVFVDTTPGKKLFAHDDVPEDSYPERIVECINISDRRRIANLKTPSPTVSCPKHRLFMRRDFLVDIYDPEQVLYGCELCGKKFTFLSMYNLHTRTCKAAILKQQRINNRRIEIRLRKMARQNRTNDPSWICFNMETSCMYPKVFFGLNFIPGPAGAQPCFSSHVPVERQPLVDLKDIAEELDEGNYESLPGRFYGDHMEECCVCRSSRGIVVCCEFCKNVTHRICAKKKINFKDSMGSEDDFVCYVCVRKVQHNRKRRNERRKVRARLRRPPQFERQEKAPAAPAVGGGLVTTSAGRSFPSRRRRRRGLVMDTFDEARYAVTYDECPTGGSGGLLCCSACTTAYVPKMNQMSTLVEQRAIVSRIKKVEKLLIVIKETEDVLKDVVNRARESETRMTLY